MIPSFTLLFSVIGIGKIQVARISCEEFALIRRELFVLICYNGFAEPRLRYKHQKAIPPFPLLTRARGSTKGKRYARRTAHRQPHQGGTQQAGTQHHLAGTAIGLLKAERLQNLQPPVDLHRPLAQNLRPAGLRLLQVLFGLEERKEKRMKFRKNTPCIGNFHQFDTILDIKNGELCQFCEFFVEKRANSQVSSYSKL